MCFQPGQLEIVTLIQKLAGGVRIETSHESSGRKYTIKQICSFSVIFLFLLKLVTIMCSSWDAIRL